MRFRGINLVRFIEASIGNSVIISVLGRGSWVKCADGTAWRILADILFAKDPPSSRHKSGRLTDSCAWFFFGALGQLGYDRLVSSRV